jgi:putative nucleotidyltransferase with HDIG domain
MDDNDIIRRFPEINEIQDASLRRAVVRVWLLAVQKGGWKTIDDIPFTLLLTTQRTLIDHTRTVTRMAMAIARERDDLDMDTVIAGGIVHDVGKLLEYQRKGKTITKSDHGRLIRHPVSGYALACEADLPAAIAHIIAAHSTEGEKVQRSREAIVIHHCDFIDFDIARA